MFIYNKLYYVSFSCYQSCETFLHPTISSFTPKQRTVLVQQAESLCHFQGAFCGKSSCWALCYIFCTALDFIKSAQAQTLVLRGALPAGSGWSSICYVTSLQWFRRGWTVWEQGKSPQETQQFGLYLQGNCSSHCLRRHPWALSWLPGGWLGAQLLHCK